MRKILRYVKMGATKKDKLKILIFFVLPRILITPCHVFSKKLYSRLSRFFYTHFFPTLRIKLREYVFICRRNSLDFYHLKPEYEEHLKKIFASVHGNVFIDIGAHVGRYSVLYSKNFKKVIAIEPEPNNFKRLLQHVRLNKLLKKVYCFNFAIGEKNEIKYLFVSAILGSGTHSLLHTSHTSSHSIKIKCYKLDTLLRKIDVKPSEISLIKIDVEGYEYCVLRGSLRTLLSTNAKIIIEIQPKNLEKVSALLKKYGFRLEKIKENDYLATKI